MNTEIYMVIIKRLTFYFIPFTVYSIEIYMWGLQLNVELACLSG